MAKFEQTINGIFPELATELEKEILSSGISMRLVDESIYEVPPLRVISKVYDKYFIRNESRSCLSITLIEDGEKTHVVAMSAGGSQGLLVLNFSWGAETALVDVVKRFLDKKVSSLLR